MKSYISKTGVFGIRQHFHTFYNFMLADGHKRMYNVYNQCKEVPELEYEDGLHYIYFYTDGTKGGTPEIKTINE